MDFGCLEVQILDEDGGGPPLSTGVWLLLLLLLRRRVDETVRRELEIDRHDVVDLIVGQVLRGCLRL